MRKSSKILSLCIVFALIFGTISSLAVLPVAAAAVGDGGTTIALEDWKIAPTGHLSVGETEYALTKGLPAEVANAADAYNPNNPLADWVDAKAPGTVAGALLDAGKYSELFKDASGETDVFFDANMTKIPFTDFAKPWWWRTSANIPQTERNKKVTLTFKGINYVARIWVNGHELVNVNNHITDIRELQNRTGTFPEYTYSAPSGSTITDFWCSVANYTNSAMIDPESPYSFDALKSKFIGAFRTYELDITEYLNNFDAVNGSVNNVILVENTRGYYKQFNDDWSATTGDLLPFWVDWHPTPPDNNMGLIGKAFISTSGDVRLTNPAVASKVALSLDSANVTFFVTASNLSKSAVNGTLTATIIDPEGKQVGTPLSQAVVIPAAAYNQEIAMTTTVGNPQLWWPYMSGDQPLYHVEYSFVINGAVSHTLDHRFGIREITNEVNTTVRNIGNTTFRNQMQVYVNHKPVLIRGGGYCPTDMYLRQREKDHQGVIDYVKYMGMNSIRDEGKFWSEDLLELLDENGIMFLTGWCCCDRGQNPAAWYMSERYMAYEALYAQIYTHRSHPSMVMWINGSDMPAEGSSTTGNAFNVGRKYLEIESRLNWFDIGAVACSADSSTSGITGASSGLKMSVGYDSGTPTDYYANNRGTFAFVSEGHGGAGIPVIETMRKMIPEENLWPHNTGENYNKWNYHSTRENFPNIDTIEMFIDNTYGGSDTFEEWLMKAQIYEYDIQRAQYESFNLHRYANATGHINWMTTGTRPGLMWNQFDFYMNPHGSTFGAAKGNEPVHIFYDYWQKDIYVINNTPDAKDELTASCTVYDIDGNIISTLEDKIINLEADGMTERTGTATNRTIGYTAADKTDFGTEFTPLTIEYGKQILDSTGIEKVWTMSEFNDSLTRPTSDVYFLKLELKDDSGKIISRNDYAVPRRGDITGAGGDWARTTPHQNADMTQLNQLPKVNLKLNEVSKTSGDIITQTFTVTNDSDAIAYGIELKAYKDAERTELVSPVIYGDNLFTLYPGETRTIDISHRSKYFDGYANVIATCYNNVITNKQEPGNLYAAAYSTQVATAGASTNLARARTATLGASGNGNNAMAFSSNAVSRSNGTMAYTIVEADYGTRITLNNSNPYVTLNLGEIATFDRIITRWNNQTSTGGVANTMYGRPDSVKVEISSDGTDFETILTYDNSKSASVMTNLVFDKPYTAQFIRLTPTGNRTLSPVIDMLTNAYPDGPTANSRRPWMSGIGQVNASTNFLITSLEVYRSYSHLIQVDFAGVDNTITVDANTRDGYGKVPAVISSSVADKYSRMRMIPNDLDKPVEFTITPEKAGDKVYATLNGVNISDQLKANPDGTYTFLSDATDDFAVLTISSGDIFNIAADDEEIAVNYMLVENAKVDMLVILAVYDANGRLVASKVAQEPGDGAVIENSLSVSLADAPGAHNAKALLWRMDSFIPLRNAVEWTKPVSEL